MKDQVTGIVLAGGQAKRFGKKDKGLYIRHNKALIESSLESLQPQVNEIIISCNRNRGKYGQFGFETVIDQRELFQGPLAGIEAGLLKCQTKYALIYACDQLAARTDLVSTLHASMKLQHSDIVCVRNRKRIHYLTALLRVDLLPSLQNYLDQGHRKVADWYAENQFSFVELGGRIPNINAEVDLVDAD